MKKQRTDPFNRVLAEADIVTASPMKEIERKAAEAGLSYYQMMENAGTGAAEYIARRHPVECKTVCIFCGKGNNGGDGFVAARKLKEKGAEVKLFLAEGAPKTDDAIKNCQICKEMNIPLCHISDNEEETSVCLRDADIIIDAIYGTGFHGELEKTVRKVTRQINTSDAAVYALDIPSGLNGDSGIADPDAVRADETVVFHRLKPAHVAGNAKAFCGQVTCISIGIERAPAFFPDSGN